MIDLICLAHATRFIWIEFEEKIIGKIVAGFTTENHYVGVFVGIEISKRNGKVKFKIRDEKSVIRRCNSVYYREEK